MHRIIQWKKRGLLKRKNPLIFLHSHYLPKNIRPLFQAVSQLELEMNQISKNQNSQSLSLAKLEYWKENIENIFKGQKPQNEPISRTIYEYLQNNKIPLKPFTLFFQAIEHEIYNPQSVTIQELIEQIRLKKQLKFLTLTSLLQIPLNVEKDLNYFQVVERMAIGEGLLYFILQIPYHLQKQQNLIPSEICSHFSLNIRNMWDKKYGKPKEEFFDAIMELFKKAKFYRL